MPTKEAEVRESWNSGIQNELSFWDEWLASKGGKWSESYKDLMNPKRELDPRIRALIPAPPRSVVKILDVGAGPVTSMAGEWADRHVVTFAVDPLAEQYEASLTANNVTPPVWTKKGEAERLEEEFLTDEFDLVHAANCRDHCYDPVRSILSMLEVVKPGRFVLLEHAENEGEFQNYDGMHQWNFLAEGDDLIVWRPGQRTSLRAVTKGLADLAVEVRPFESGRRWVTAKLRKNDESDDGVSPLRHQIVDRVNVALKKVPFAHGLLRRSLEKLSR